jgi:alkanesulfonate monooxygenase SsuD/methylene tetrahydromethanopterin reductase-like flavin-dependent oxidoreductase (luciferase family)
MKVGVQLPEVEREVRWPELAAMARAAEETGLDSVWLGDHLLYRDDGRPERGPWDCWTTLAGLATVTSRVELGPLVACTAFHAPALLARTAAAVDELSGGRLRLGLGAGWNEVEFRAFGLPFDRRVSRFEEAFEIVRRLLACEHVTFDGTFNRLDDAVLLPPPARTPPLMVGGDGPRLLAATLPYVAWWNTWYDRFDNHPERFAALNARIDDACVLAGREPADVRRSTCLYVRIGAGAGERPTAREAPPIQDDDLPGALTTLAQAGADEVILVLDPITESSIRSLRTALPSG